MDAQNKNADSEPQFRNVKWLNIVSLCLSILFLILSLLVSDISDPPFFYKLLFFILLLLPVIGIVWHGAGLRPFYLTLFSQIKGLRKSVDIFITCPAAAITITSVANYNLVNYLDCCVPALIIFGVVLLILILTHSFWNKEKPVADMAALLLTTAIYSFGAACGANCICDNAKPNVYQVLVKDKYTSSGRHTTYKLTVDGWAEHSGETLSVPHSLYSSVAINEMVALYYKHGLLGMPWVYIQKRTDQPK